MSFAEPVLARNRPARQRRIAHLLSMLTAPDTALRNVLTTLADATPDQETRGLAFYPSANDLMRDLSSETGLPLSTCCAVLAVTSPQTPWSLNVEMTLTACRTRDPQVPHTGDVQGKVAQLFSGSYPSAVLGGRKVRSFYANVYRPGRPGPVTVDRHAASVIAGRPLYGNDARIEAVGHYTFLAATYRTAARLTGLSPHDVQSIVWHVWRDRHAPGWSVRDGAPL